MVAVWTEEREGRAWRRELGERIRWARQRAHMSQMELAAQLGITQASVSAWECSTASPSTERLVQLMRLFDAGFIEALLELGQRSR